ncbi:type-F conjugative transfer system pilin assembly protein TrbC [Vibrio sonorensis]|uniref:type-F conjugative transfer system pilin assembly protein TrbC n=1 Tax=Vibrio sonorensis TaxID=1004316 RepID=UPI0008D9DCFA|nr:type-F conjugative transfer system pilin assembly protein TrbC [Vibrio sonorensis]
MKGFYPLLLALSFSSECFASQTAYSQEELKQLAETERAVSHVPDFENYLNYQTKQESFKDYAIDLNRDNYITSGSPLSNTPSQAPLPNVLVFTSLGLGDLTLKQQLQQSEDYKVPLIIRGILPSGFPATSARIMELLGIKVDGKNASHQINSGFAISPDWFDKFNIDSVPVVIVIEEGKCLHDSDCKESDFDIVRGNIPIPTALEMIAESGDASSVAKKVLARKQHHE